MIYEWKSRVRYSEIGVDGKLTLTALVNYFQDCSTFQSEELGLGWRYLAAHKKAWVLSSWQIEVKRYPSMGENITVKTWAHSFKGFYGGRNFLMVDEREEVLAYANTNWVFMDVETGHPAKTAQEEAEAYGLEEPYEMTYAPRKISFPEDAVPMEGFQIGKQHLDTNHHVNNEEYIAMAQEYLPEDWGVSSMRAEYKKAALLHDIVIPFVKQEKERCTVALCDEQKKPYAIVEFYRKTLGKEKVRKEI
ncbi:MAG: thioesterase [Lachnospiraceae bacterium]|nr:thioesterase [Robinsoniella sp.]MDY3767165.1 thioesterase [Lachnospiraceae bacterium]